MLEENTVECHADLEHHILKLMEYMHVPATRECDGDLDTAPVTQTNDHAETTNLRHLKSDAKAVDQTNELVKLAEDRVCAKHT